MERAIVSFHQDQEQHWVADLDCGHAQHVRHNPPWQERAWVTTEQGRAERVGTLLDCVLCDRRELPAGFVAYKQTAVFDQSSMPAGLRSQHSLKRGVWGAIHVAQGALRFRVHGPTPSYEVLTAGDVAFIPPEVTHEVEPEGAVAFYVEFLKHPSA